MDPWWDPIADSTFNKPTQTWRPVWQFDLFWLCAVLCATPVSSMGLYQSCDCDLLSSAIFGVLSAVSIFGVLSAVSTASPSTCARGNHQELGGVVRQSGFVFICPQSGDRFIFLLLFCVSWCLPCSSSIFKIAVLSIRAFDLCFYMVDMITVYTQNSQE